MTARSIFGRDIAEMLAPQGERRQDLPGFDEDYVDIVDYIIRSTHRFWEQKDIGLVATHYGVDCPIWTLAGPVGGIKGVMDGTMRALATFPDRTLIGDAVIWSGDAAKGYLASHRIISTATHHGAGEFGPATGRPLHFLTIADCHVVENRVVEEWLVRDNSHIALQLGITPSAMAKAQAAADTPDTPAVRWWAQQFARVQQSSPTPFPARVPPDDPQALAPWLFDSIVNHRLLGLVREAYAGNAAVDAPGGRRLFGHGEIIGWWAALLGSFGGARAVIDHVAVRPASDDPGDGDDVAIRWTLAGRHDGPALYGAPSGRDIVVLGVTHWRVVGGRIAREWTVFDEVAVWRQTLGVTA